MWDIDLSPDRRQSELYNADGENNKVWVFSRASDRVMSPPRSQIARFQPGEPFVA